MVYIYVCTDGHIFMYIVADVDEAGKLCIALDLGELQKDEDCNDICMTNVYVYTHLFVLIAIDEGDTQER